MADVKKFKDIEQVAGQPIKVQVGGKEYLLAPLRLRDHSEARQHMRGQAMQAYLSALDVLPAEHRPALEEKHEQIASLLRGRIRDTELFDFYDTLEGMQYLIWQSLKQNHSDVTLEVVEGILMDPDQLDALTTAVIEMSGMRDEGDGDKPENPTIPSSQSGNPTSPPSAKSSDGPSET